MAGLNNDQIVTSESKSQSSQQTQPRTTTKCQETNIETYQIQKNHSDTIAPACMSHNQQIPDRHYRRFLRCNINLVRWHTTKHSTVPCGIFPCLISKINLLFCHRGSLQCISLLNNLPFKNRRHIYCRQHKEKQNDSTMNQRIFKNLFHLFSYKVSLSDCKITTFFSIVQEKRKKK